MQKGLEEAATCQCSVKTKCIKTIRQEDLKFLDLMNR
jgi:hypothetical protein